jgi:Tol biopolymer transport system component
MRDNNRGSQDIWIAGGDGSNERLLVPDVSDGWIGNAYLTPDDSRLAITLYAEDRQYFWVSDVQGNQRKLVAEGEQVYYLPTANSNRILLQTIDGDDQALYLVTIDGQEKQMILKDTDQAWYYFDLPDNNKSSCAFVRIPSYLDGEESTLSILQIETGEITEITSASEAYIFPAYQADSENLQYIILYPEENEEKYTTKWQIHNADLTGDHRELIAEGTLDGDIQAVHWAYDGSSILLSTDGGYPEGDNLYRLTSDGSITLLASQEDYIVIQRYATTVHDRYWAYLTWDAETEEFTLFLAKEGADPQPVTTDGSIWFGSLSRDGLRVTYLTQHDADANLIVHLAETENLQAEKVVGQGAYDAGSLFTSDGEYLLIGEWKSEDSLSLASANADGSQPNRLPGTLKDLFGRFTPDEEALIFGGRLTGYSTGDEHYSQFLYHFSNGRQVELTRAAPYPVTFDFSPDGRYIVYDVYSIIDNSNLRAIYRAEMDGSQPTLLIANAYSPAWATNQSAGIWTAEGTTASPGGLFGGLGGP